ncbi:hypothetical protein EKO24_019055 [Candidatus Methylobacter oryzae]|uniref:Chromosome partition protein Smc n=2 Tax=Candidatus Methylobacter oryzae TaxID=2497749 RepID=A0ABY3C6W6_9GAMM|nr:hypothetical protein EKO24_019055 [Candidatus Methylobacter oryzae]
MKELIGRLSAQKSSPRLWVERLAIFGKAEAGCCIRSIEFRRGLNVVWAHEPVAGSATGIHAAGHGVGKTSLCLLLRHCLGDNAKSVNELRDELYSELPHGGVGMVVHVADETFTVFRFFNAYKDGIVKAGNDLESLLRDGGNLVFKDFDILLANAMMSNVSPRLIPETGQTIEWHHVLAWITRDQGSRFKSYFAWREGEGTRLQRSRQDPPIVIRAVLGLLDRQESKLLRQIRTLELDLEKVQQETARLEQEPILIRRRIESELRAWLQVADDLPLYSDDLFKESVVDKVEEARKKAEANLAEADARYAQAGEQLIELQVDGRLRKRDYDQADKDFQLADAARRQDESATKQIANRRLSLLELTGHCQHGDLPFQDCKHIQDELQRLQAMNMKDRRDQRALAHAAEDWTARTVAALARRNALNEAVEKASSLISAKEQECKSLRMKRDSVALEVDRGRRLLDELARWERTSGSPAAAETIRKSVARSGSISSDIDNKRLQLQMLKQQRSSREKSLGELTDILAQALLSNEAFGSFALRDEVRPFQLSVRGGEAYRVMEVLLGDLVCMLDAVDPASSFPGLLIHDCPREADMSSGLYENFLLMIQRIELEAYGDEAPFQYIVTTTTPPPSLIQCLPYLRETLDPSTDDGLLFRRRFNASRQSEYLE